MTETPITADMRRTAARAEVALRQEQDRAERMERYPTEHPHLLGIALHSGVVVNITCPGEKHCPLWYEGRDGQEGKCGLRVEFEEYGPEMLEYQIGPEYQPTFNPFPIAFTWSGGGEDDPPEIEWWALGA